MDLEVGVLCVPGGNNTSAFSLVEDLQELPLRCLPFVSFEIFQLDPERVVLVVRQHVDVLVAEPEFLARIAEAVLVVGPVAVEVLPGFAKVVTPLNDLQNRRGISRLKV